MINWCDFSAAVWQTEEKTLRPVRRPDRVNLSDLIGVKEQAQQLLENTQDLLAGKPAENALLWGARGSGKSALIKGVFTALADHSPLRLIQLAREDMASLPVIAEMAEDCPYHFIVFCDDLVFGDDSGEYRALRVFLQGSIELPPSNMVVYATSNLRYILPQDRRKTERSFCAIWSRNTVNKRKTDWLLPTDLVFG